MVAVSDRVILEDLVAEVKRLRRLVQRQGVVIDAMREAWLLPPVGVLRAERKALRQAEGTRCPDLPRAQLREPTPADDTRGPDSTKRAHVYKQACDRAREEGRKAGARGVPADDCPYKPGAWGPRKAWLQAHAKALSTTAGGAPAHG